LTTSRVTSTASNSWLDRRECILGAGAAGIASGALLAKAYAQMASAPDYSLRITPLRLELAPGKVIDTFGYNGTVPGPLIRVREGRQLQHRHP
jgi:FtsP/CotA-like multicopper oxidase with cupredoxin domain